MKIDRHNYEEFFLLYVDNELSKEQKKSVDQFVQENPDLIIELELLLQTTLKADDAVIFSGKEMLLKKESDAIIHLDNYEEYLIAYIDDELNDAERIEFFKFAAAHPHVKAELAVYEQTKLQPEPEIVFANKETLYRREETVKVISIQWWKIAVAAAVILAIGITTITVLNQPASIQPAVANTNKKQPAEKNNPSTPIEQTIKKDGPADIKTSTESVATINTQQKKAKETAVQQTANGKKQQRILAPLVEKDNTESLASNNAPDNTNPALQVNKKNETKIGDAVTRKADEPIATNEVAVNTNLPKQNINEKIVTPQTNQPLDNKETAQEITNNDAVYASYDEGKNKKTRGFFRKAARVFERRTNISSSDEQDKEDKVMIGALAIKLK